MSQVLIVDPNPVNLDVAQEAFNLCYTKTVHEAARTVRENRPDLVTTETALPDGDAQDVIRLGSGQEPSIPVVFVAQTTPQMPFFLPSAWVHSIVSQSHCQTRCSGRRWRASRPVVIAGVESNRAYLPSRVRTLWLGETRR
jgi:hypothetical protein